MKKEEETGENWWMLKFAINQILVAQTFKDCAAQLSYMRHEFGGLYICSGQSTNRGKC